MSVIDIKKERSDLKRRITLVSKRVTGSIEREARNTVIAGFYQELESLYCDFLTVNEEYVTLVSSSDEYAEHITVSGLDLDQYKEDVTSHYDEAKRRYDIYLAHLENTPSKTNEVLSNMQEQLHNLDQLISNHISTCKVNQTVSNVSNSGSDSAAEVKRDYALQALASM